MRPTSIVKSEAFRAINLLLDGKAENLNFWLEVVREKVDAAFKAGGTIDTRTTDEDTARGKKKLPADLMMIEDITGALEHISHIRAEIGELQRFKLRLLNDYDLTHGDDREQRAVFAET